LVDTAGLTLGSREELELSLQKQIEVALKEADLVILVVDGKQPKSSVNVNVLKKSRKTKKLLVLCVNKLDSPKTAEEKLIEFSALGIKPMFGISSVSGRGIGDMLDSITHTLSLSPSPIHGDGAGGEVDDDNKDDEKSIAVAIVGKPNVGKSSIFNSLVKEERVVVSPLPGTTRTAIDSDVLINDQRYTFIDTAGLKKKAYRQEQPDIFGGFQTFKSIRRSDVCFFVVDATEEVTKQDQRVASEIIQMEKGCIILANKVDLFKNDREKLQDYISAHFPFLWMCPVFFVSAVTGEGLDEALGAIKPIFDRRKKEIDNQTLSEFLSKKLRINGPKLLRDQKRPKVFSLHQRGINPPTFELLVNHPAAISQQFRKFVENGIIRDLDFYGTPIKLRLQGKDKT